MTLQTIIEEPMILKSEQSRFVDYSFGNVKSQSLEVSGAFSLSNIALGSPTDNGTVAIPSKCAVVILQNAAVFTQLTMKLPISPVYGQTLTIISVSDIPNLTLSNGAFGTIAPSAISAGIPIKLIFAGQWYNF